MSSMGSVYKAGMLLESDLIEKVSVILNRKIKMWMMELGFGLSFTVC